uniref:Uncharacterized protein n=1 Tax=Romanomermis culicivorax TaxID=13658 RepID=A0A915JNZ0_ROMCU
DPFFVLENKNNNGIQKFDPRIFCPVHKNLDIATTGCISDISDSNMNNYQQSSNLNCDQDTIGFFIAKFVKKMNK